MAETARPLTSAQLPGMRVIHSKRQSMPDGYRVYWFVIELEGKMYGLSGREVEFKGAGPTGEPLPGTEVYPLEVVDISTTSTVLEAPGKPFPTTFAQSPREYENLVQAAVAVFLGLLSGSKNVILRVSFSSREAVVPKSYERVLQ